MILTNDYYISPWLPADLQRSGTDLVGTFRINHTGVPACLRNVKRYEKDSRRGGIMHQLAVFFFFNRVPAVSYLRSV